MCRAKRYHDKLKAEGRAPSLLVKTKNQRREQRGYWAEMKRRSRARMSAQKQESVRKYDWNRSKDRCRKKEAKDRLRIRQAAQRMKRVLPRDSEKYAAVLKHLIRNASPQQKTAIQNIGIGVGSPKKRTGTQQMDLKKVFDALKCCGRKKKVIESKRRLLLACKSKYASLRALSRSTGVRWSYLQKVASSHTDAVWETREGISHETEQEVKDFYVRPDISVCLPDQNKVTKHGVRYHLQLTLEKAFHTFASDHPQNKIGLSSFKKRRPKNVKPIDSTPYKDCICEYCANLALQLKSLSTHLVRSCTECDNLRAGLASNEACVNQTLCSRSGEFHKMPCVKRECGDCGTSAFVTALAHIEEHVTSSHWYRWVINPTNKKMTLVSVSGSLSDQLELLTSDLAFMSSHLFTARWQQRQMSMITKNVPDKTVIQVMDFGQNYVCKVQDEPQTVYWDGHNQVTVHPVVCYYKCPRDNGTVRDKYICLSSDLKHDNCAVKQFVAKVNQCLQKKVEINSHSVE